MSRKYQIDKYLSPLISLPPQFVNFIKEMRTRKRASKATKTEEKKVNFFNDPAGPFVNAPQQVKDLFEKDAHSPYVALKEFKTPFKAIPTRVNVCTNKMGSEPNPRAYHCNNCHLDEQVYCWHCFKLQEHRDHDFYVDEKSDNYCDCGKNDDNNCKDHQSDEIVLSIPIKQQEEFLDFFLALWKVFLYLKKGSRRAQDLGDRIIDEMIRTLIQLNEGSVHYIRLTTKMLSSEVEIGSQSQYIFHEIFPHHSCTNLFRKMMADKAFHFQLAKNVQLLRQQRDRCYLGYSLMSLVNPLLSDLKIMHQLAEENIFMPANFDSYVRAAKNHDETSLLGRFVDYQIEEKKQSNEELLNFITEDRFSENLHLYEEKVKEFLLNQGIRYFKKIRNSEQHEEKQTQKKQKKTTRRNKTTKDLQSAKKIIQSCNDKSNQTKRVIKMVSRLIFYFASNDIEKLESILKHKSNISDNILIILSFSATNLSSFLEQPEIVIIILQLIELNIFKQYLITHLWKQFFQGGKSMSDIFKQTYFLLSSVAYIPRVKQALQKNRREMCASEERINDQWFRCLLYQAGEIEKQNILALKSQGIEKQFGAILQELCTYNEEKHLFVYTSQRQYPDDILKFTPLAKLNKFTHFLKMKVKYKQYFSIKNSNQEQILYSLFSCKEFYKNFKQFWQNGLKETEKSSCQLNRWKSKNMGLVYVLVLVCIDNIMKGGNSDISKELEEIVNDSDYRFRFEFLTEDENIPRILPISKTNQPANEAFNLQSRKEKKKKLYEKYKNNNQKMIDKFQNSDSLKTYIPEQETVCLLCKEVDNIQNPLFYLADIKVNRTPVSAFFGSDNKTKTSIFTCFHVLCLNCYRKKIRDHDDFSCPLCSKKMSCLLPLRSNITDEEVQQNYQNSIITSIGKKYQLFSFGGVFKLFFCSLVESSGLNSLIFINKKQQRKSQNEKIENLILNLLISLVNHSNQSQKKKYHHMIDKLLVDVDNCQKQLVGRVQDIMINYFRMKIFFSEDKQFLVEKLAYLHKLLTFQQYAVIRDNLLDIKVYIQKNCPENLNLLASTSSGYKSLFIYTIKLPPTTDQLYELCQNRTCQRCGKRRLKYFLCLFCRKVFCRQCIFSSQHSQRHMKNFLCFEFSQSRLHRFENNYNRSNDIYYNQFMECYNETKDVCYLDENKLKRIVNDFIDFSD